MKKFLLTLVLLFCSSHMAFSQDLQNGLLAYYPFNGNANDESGNGNDGTVFGALLTTDRFGNTNSAYQFDGTSYIRKDQFNLTVSDFTLSLWILADDLPSWYREPFAIHSGGNAINFGDKGILLDYNSIGALAAVYTTTDGANPLASQVQNVTPGAWHHIVFRREGNIQTVYLNSALVATINYAIGALTIQNGFLEIGAPNFWRGGWTQNGRGQAKWQGKLDDIRLYDRALTSVEIQTLFGEEISSLDIGLVAYFPFNGNANDESTNGHDGTPAGASLTRDRFNCLNSAYLFDGIDDFILIPTSASLRSAHYSLSLWLRTTQVPQVQSVPFSGNYHLSSVSGNGYQLEIHPQGGGSADQFTRPTVNHGGVAGVGPINDGSWHHVVTSWDGTTTSIYLNGELRGVQVTPCCGGAQPGPIRWTAPFQDFKIGFKSGSQQLQQHDYYAGVLDDIRIYNRALNATEIRSLFDAVQPICNSNPIANAGPDQTLECTSPQGSAVTLDGSTSSDPDNDPLTYTWRESSNILAGPTASPISLVTLGLGSHTIELTVDDGNGGASATDITINVADNTAPVPNVENLADATGECNVTVTAPTATDACGGSITGATTDPLTYDAQGSFTITWTYDDGNGNGSTQTQSVVVADVTAPVITADLIPIAGDDDDNEDDNDEDSEDNLFAVQCSATDNCDANLTVTAFMQAPSLTNPAVEFKVKKGNKLKYDLKKNKVKVEGPNPQGLWAAVQNAGGVAVPDGQVLKLKTTGGQKHEFKFDKDGNLKEVKGTAAPTLVCTATDAANNVSIETVSAVLTSDDDDVDGDKDDDDDGDDDEDEDKAHKSNANTLNSASLPDVFALAQNHPNPFNPSTKITFAVPEAGVVTLSIYNLRGQLIQTLHSGIVSVGVHSVVWDGRNAHGARVSSGVYLYRLAAKGYVVTKKLVFTK